MTINSSKHKSTGFTPAFLNLKHALWMPFVLALDPVKKDNTKFDPKAENAAIWHRFKKNEKIKKLFKLVN